MIRFKYVFVFLILILAGSTSCMRSVRISMLRPAPITVPNHVQKIVIVDRTQPENEAIRIVEGVLTGEMPFEVRNAVQASMTSIAQELNNSPRYTVIRASERYKSNSLLGAFPLPMDWGTINSIARQYDADAVLALEVFDVNFIVTNATRLVKKMVKNKDGKEEEREVPEFVAEGVSTLKVGMRLYDVRDRNILDQQDFRRTNTWTATADNAAQAAARLINRTEATRYMGNLAGASYAHRIAPSYVWVSRDFFHKPRKNQYMSMGARQATVGDWRGAIETWRRGLPTSDRKTAGRMSYNIGLAHEVIGDLPSAKEWVQRSYTYYGQKRARGYARILDQRIWDQQMLDQQMAPAPERPANQQNQPVNNQNNGQSVPIRLELNKGGN